MIDAPIHAYDTFDLTVIFKLINFVVLYLSVNKHNKYHKSDNI